MQPRFTVCGGCHIDRQLRFESPPLPGRTAPASQSERVGGVATNIAVRLAAWNAQTRLAGVQPPQSLDAMKARLSDAGVDPFLVPLDGEPPSYTALLGPDGELLTGAAAMANSVRASRRGSAVVLHARAPCCHCGCGCDCGCADRGRVAQAGRSERLRAAAAVAMARRGQTGQCLLEGCGLQRASH